MKIFVERLCILSHDEQRGETFATSNAENYTLQGSTSVGSSSASAFRLDRIRGQKLYDLALTGRAERKRGMFSQPPELICFILTPSPMNPIHCNPLPFQVSEVRFWSENNQILDRNQTLSQSNLFSASRCGQVILGDRQHCALARQLLSLR